MDRFLTRALSFTSIAIFALVSARLVSQDRRYGLVIVGVIVAFAIPAFLSRRKLRRLLISGDVPKILGTWERSLERATYPETMAPLMTATTYAAYGFIDAARRALSRAARGPAWDAAIEQRLFVEALLDVYEGERLRAMLKAEELEQLPLPRTGFWMRRKISLLRRGVGALARAFAHESRADDEALLSRAGKSSPLVHWAMRYARAIVLVDGGRTQEALDLVASAPAWPEESAFHAFHAELLAHLSGEPSLTIA
ncbi:MAG: hypothetical protein KF795_03495 [Labilithrix sp.]|nr:hypothetical protein [Labilithrix sp.]MBX3219558.1 hypothetical protein [Labilithrix sp.]